MQEQRVLLVSAELEEVTALADRLLVIRAGQIVGEVDPKILNIEEIGLMMTGRKGKVKRKKEKRLEKQEYFIAFEILRGNYLAGN